jgi:hypothetical protein
MKDTLVLLALVVYLALSAWVGYLNQKKGNSFVLAFFVSLLGTPIAGLLLTYYAYQGKSKGLSKKRLAEIEAELAEARIPPPEPKVSNPALGCVVIVGIIGLVVAGVIQDKPTKSPTWY